jgi:hypothetical protein
VEKPLAIEEERLAAIEAFYGENDGPLLVTGFNDVSRQRSCECASFVADRTSPLVGDYRMNAGYVELDHWVHGPEGGGRNIGEACHVYDVFDSLSDAKSSPSPQRRSGLRRNGGRAPTISSRRSATRMAQSAR